MASREAMIDTIYRAYDARGKGDIEGLMAAFHPNAVFELKGEKDMLEVAGAVRGHQGVRAAMTGFIEAFEFLKRDIVDAMVDGDRAAVHSRLKVRFIPKEVVFTSDGARYIQIRRWKDHRTGRICGYRSDQGRRDHLRPQIATASGARPGAAVDPDPPRRNAARQMPASRHGAGAATGGRAWCQGTSNGPALAVQDCRGPAAGWLVPIGRCVLPRPSPIRRALDCPHEAP